MVVSGKRGPQVVLLEMYFMRVIDWRIIILVATNLDIRHAQECEPLKFTLPRLVATGSSNCRHCARGSMPASFWCCQPAHSWSIGRRVTDSESQRHLAAVSGNTGTCKNQSMVLGEVCKGGLLASVRVTRELLWRSRPANIIKLVVDVLMTIDG